MDPLDPDYEPTKRGKEQRPGRHQTDSSGRGRGVRDSAQETASSPYIANAAYAVPPPPPGPPPGAPPIQSSWIEHRTSEGKIYYYNSITRESRWTRPDVTVAKSSNPNTANQTSIESPIAPPTQVANGGTNDTPKVQKEQALGIKRLLSSDWAIVLTNKDHEFFYNLNTMERSWEMPDEIGDLVGQLIADAMGVNLNDYESDEPAAEEEKPEEQWPRLRSSSPTNEGAHIQDLASQDDRKRKVDDLAAVPDENAKKQKTAEPAQPPEVSTDKDGHSSINSDEKEKAQQFTQFLRDKNVSPYSTWEVELPALVRDPRYTFSKTGLKIYFSVIPTAKRRKQLYEEYCVVRVAELRDEKPTKVDDAKTIFKRLLEEEVTSKMRWTDFSYRFRRNDRFLGIKPKDREKLFSEHISALKRTQSRS
ncbi:hypothetical protein DFS34DRAFT_593860 [Phlyctochytrium arcticum]|nr:hypothetical protein DFS34DRAFT_593860 [Phlyctochytrium arcticum]